jgi:hypothetical protein
VRVSLLYNKSAGEGITADDLTAQIARGGHREDAWLGVQAYPGQRLEPAALFVRLEFSSIGERSRPAIDGSTLRIGARTGSVRLYTTLVNRLCRYCGSHDRITATSTASE